MATSTADPTFGIRITNCTEFFDWLSYVGRVPRIRGDEGCFFRFLGAGRSAGGPEKDGGEEEERREGGVVHCESLRVMVRSCDGIFVLSFTIIAVIG